MRPSLDHGSIRLKIGAVLLALVLAGCSAAPVNKTTGKKKRSVLDSVTIAADYQKVMLGKKLRLQVKGFNEEGQEMSVIGDWRIKQHEANASLTVDRGKETTLVPKQVGPVVVEVEAKGIKDELKIEIVKPIKGK